MNLFVFRMKCVLVVVMLVFSFNTFSQKGEGELKMSMVYQSVYDAFKGHVHHNLNPRIRRSLCFSGVVDSQETYIRKYFQKVFENLNDFDSSLVKSVNSGFDYKLQKKKVPKWRFKCNYELKIFKAIEYKGLIYILFKINGEYERDWYLFQYKPGSEIPITVEHSSLVY